MYGIGSLGGSIRGFVLAGGRSRRMGGSTDKALLTHRDGSTQLERMTRLVADATGRSATVLGPLARYANLHVVPVENVLEDIVPDSGPLGGIHSALTHTDCDWNLIAAVDLPNVTLEFLKQLLENSAGARCTIAAGQPLCGVYHRSCLPDIVVALESGMLKVTALASRLQAVEIVPPDAQMLQNMNTMSDWEGHLRGPHE